MLSLGYGVIRDTLGSHQKFIILFGIVYFLVMVINDSIVLYFPSDLNSWSVGEEIILTSWTYTSALHYILDWIGMIWILRSLQHTLRFVTQLNQTQKLIRTKNFITFVSHVHSNVYHFDDFTSSFLS
jgi:Lung seven transmembrane receptor